MFENLPSFVKIVEVGPRDGLQNERTVLPTDEKFNLISGLVSAGLKNIEATSFVRVPKIPQMVDAIELYEQINSSSFKDSINFSALVPNVKGMENAGLAKVKEIAVFTATSDLFNKKNINATVDESLIRIKKVIEMALSNGMKVRGYISTAFGCPYGGDVSVETFLSISEQLFNMGVYEISIGDTIGSATPREVISLINNIKSNFDLSKFAMHFHDTKKMALANILVSLEHGISTFDSSVGGLGGCPYAKGASGNVATESVVYLLNSLGIKTGVDLEKLIEVSEKIKIKLGRS